jgi:hypothetical protein
VGSYKEPESEDHSIGDEHSSVISLIRAAKLVTSKEIPLVANLSAGGRLYLMRDTNHIASDVLPIRVVNKIDAVILFGWRISVSKLVGAPFFSMSERKRREKKAT